MSHPPAPTGVDASSQRREELRRLDRDALGALQLQRLNRLLESILPANHFFSRKLTGCPTRLESLEQLAELPMMTKDEIQGPQAQVAGEAAPVPANLTWPVEQYTRYHQTSGTKGAPMPVYDTLSDWQWWIDCWQYVLDAAELEHSDRALLAFSFGPFIGFWSAHDALGQRSTMVVPGGGMSTLARLDLLQRSGATALFSTPSYALRMAEVAAENGIDLARHAAVRKIVVAGEAGGSIPATRRRIELAWGARVTDHSGASELGAWGFGDSSGTGLHVIESEFIAEFISLESDRPAAEGELAQLVLTPLGRYGMPAIRYRTGDLVRPRWSHSEKTRFVILEGGVLGRVDDMLVVRGVNIFPSSIEQILLNFPEVDEYRFTIRRVGAMDQMSVEVEDRLDQPERIAQELKLRLGLHVEVRQVAPQSLPRFEGKGQRFHDQRPR